METHLNKSFFTLSREALIYINGLEDPEAKKDFLINCFLTQCEETLELDCKQKIEDYPSDRLISMGIAISSRREKPKLEYVDPIDSETLQKMKDAAELYEYDRVHHSRKTIGELSDKAKEIIENENLLKFDLPSREKFDKFIEDNGLKKFTPPESLPRPEMKNITKPDTLKGFLDVWLKDGLHVEEYGVRPVNNFKLLEELKYYQPPHPDKVKKYDKEDLQSAFEASRQDIMGIPLFNNFEEYLKAITPNI